MLLKYRNIFENFQNGKKKKRFLKFQTQIKHFIAFHRNYSWHIIATQIWEIKIFKSTNPEKNKK